ncbi:carboxypeptidase-like regulatory domain-containing protein [Massilia sp. CCM 9206]|uniref:MSCRAMM family protein n=1 Tax=Massilia pseudoviolaceinigra TaxID=3057165 RepID=UPI002796D878|nr:carboxypeptidase-like regulatory domain-containing protein [Massilia sp. CCM 9206]MDQ1924178.1 carboxypeptidase-like regulatory domain-containing protein [Massilia sp. CCM 9206]
MKARYRQVTCSCSARAASLAGRVPQADGSSPVTGAQVTVVRDQPMEQVGFAVTDAAGNFTLADVSAGSFTLSVIDPASGDRGRAKARIDTEGETRNVDICLNGQGQVNVTVTDGGGPNVPNTTVTLTVLNGVRDTRTMVTHTSGQARFVGVAAGDFSISRRDGRRVARWDRGTGRAAAAAGGNDPGQRLRRRWQHLAGSGAGAHPVARAASSRSSSLQRTASSASIPCRSATVARRQVGGVRDQQKFALHQARMRQCALVDRGVRALTPIRKCFDSEV